MTISDLCSETQPPMHLGGGFALSAAWNTWGPTGGYVAGALVRAVTLADGEAIRTLNVDFLDEPHPGPAEVTSACTRAGTYLRCHAVELAQGGRSRVAGTVWSDRSAPERAAYARVRDDLPSSDWVERNGQPIGEQFSWSGSVKVLTSSASSGSASHQSLDALAVFARRSCEVGCSCRVARALFLADVVPFVALARDRPLVYVAYRPVTIRMSATMADSSASSTDLLCRSTVEFSSDSLIVANSMLVTPDLDLVAHVETVATLRRWRRRRTRPAMSSEQ